MRVASHKTLNFRNPLEIAVPSDNSRAVPTNGAEQTASLEFKRKALKIVIGYFIFYFFKIKGSESSVAIIELYFI
jgi:hypothetical protein